MKNSRPYSKAFFVLVFCGLLLLGCDSATEQAGNEKKPSSQDLSAVGRIVALGDSLTAGAGVNVDKSYPALLEKRLASEGYRYEVVNAGVSGETSSGTLSRLDWIIGQEPEIVILEIGANDGLRGIDPALLETNIDTILVRLEKHDIIVVFAGMKMVRNMGREYTDKFDAVYPRLAQRHEVIFMPFFLEGVATVQELNQADGLHPNEKGHAVIVDNLYPYVLQAIDELEANKGETDQRQPEAANPGG